MLLVARKYTIEWSVCMGDGPRARTYTTVPVPLFAADALECHIKFPP